MLVSLIWAMTKNRVIGRDGQLPWRLPNEMAYFQRTTKGHPIIMGRKTFDSMDRRPLANRFNIVLSRQVIEVDGISHARSFDEALAIATQRGADECFVIGGSYAYEAAIHRADRLYQTIIDTELKGDVFFPDFDVSEWQQTRHERHERDSQHAYAFDTFLFERLKRCDVPISGIVSG